MSLRHCERSEAISHDYEIASLHFVSLAMTVKLNKGSNDARFLLPEFIDHQL
jgi:hypothetical protein